MPVPTTSTGHTWGMQGLTLGIDVGVVILLPLLHCALQSFLDVTTLLKVDLLLKFNCSSNNLIWLKQNSKSCDLIFSSFQIKSNTTHEAAKQGTIVTHSNRRIRAPC